MSFNQAGETVTHRIPVATPLINRTPPSDPASYDPLLKKLLHRARWGKVLCDKAAGIFYCLHIWQWNHEWARRCVLQRLFFCHLKQQLVPYNWRWKQRILCWKCVDKSRKCHMEGALKLCERGIPKSDFVIGGNTGGRLTTTMCGHQLTEQHGLNLLLVPLGAKERFRKQPYSTTRYG